VLALSDLDPKALEARLSTRWLGRRHVHLSSCGSTNDLVAAEARNGAAEGLLVTADRQTGGRGRQGRVWHSPPDANLYLSLLLRPRRSAVEVPPLTLLAGGALAQALRGLGFAARVKWPNDLLLTDENGRRRKVAGILTEAATEGDRIGHVVVGIGLNVNATEESFPDELAEKATSLRLIGGKSLSRVEVLSRVLSSLETAYESFQERGVAAAIELWEAHAELGNPCRAQVAGREIVGVVAGVDGDGALLIEDEAGDRHRVVSGEVLPGA